jgi:transposase
LAERLGVSEKTVARWRRNGLRWRWVTPADGGPKRVVIPASALARYHDRHPGQAEQAAAFTRMSADQRRAILDAARALLDQDPALTMNQTAGLLAESTGRGHETIRELLQKHDRDHAGSALFAGRDRPLDPAQHAAIERAYLAGEGAGAIAKRYGRSRSTVYRVVHQCRARRVLAQRYSYQASPTFERDDAAEVLLRPIAPPGPRARRPDSASLALLPEAVRPAFDRALPPDRLMVALLLRYNYLKFCAARVQGRVRAGDAKAADLDRCEALDADVTAARAGCIHAALPLVLSVCRRQEPGSHAQAGARLLARLVQAYPVLTALVESHDATRSARFESVLTNRLLRTFTQAIPSSPDSDQNTKHLTAELGTLGPVSDNT